MHELSLCQDLLDIIIKKGEDYKAKKITLIKLKFGAMTMVDETSLRFYFQELSKNTIAENGTVIFERTEITIRCKNCREVSILKDIFIICPLCSSMDTELLSGNEMIIENIEVET